jgi:hypothetical protein
MSVGCYSNFISSVLILDRNSLCRRAGNFIIGAAIFFGLGGIAGEAWAIAAIRVATRGANLSSWWAPSNKSGNKNKEAGRC